MTHLTFIFQKIFILDIKHQSECKFLKIHVSKLDFFTFSKMFSSANWWLEKFEIVEKMGKIILLLNQEKF